MFNRYIVPLIIPSAVPENKLYEACRVIKEFVEGNNRRFEVFENPSIRRTMLDVDFHRKFIVKLENTLTTAYISRCDLNPDIKEFYIEVLSDIEFDASGKFIPRLIIGPHDIVVTALDYVKNGR